MSTVRRVRKKYLEFDKVHIRDISGILEIEGRAFIWRSVKSYPRRSRNVRLIILQLPKKLEKYSKFTIVLIPEE